jgi:hypothetical protein
MVYGDYRPRRCGRNAKRDGFCLTHHPDTKAKRNADLQAKWDREAKLRGAKWDVESAERAVLAEVRQLGDVNPDTFEALAEADAALSALTQTPSRTLPANDPASPSPDVMDAAAGMDGTSGGEG